MGGRGLRRVYWTSSQRKRRTEDVYLWVMLELLNFQRSRTHFVMSHVWEPVDVVTGEHLQGPSRASEQSEPSSAEEYVSLVYG